MVLPGENIAHGAPDVCPDCNRRLDFEVGSSAAGYYIGTWCDCGPYSRESGYYPTHEDAVDAFLSGGYGR